MNKTKLTANAASVLALLERQRSHVLFVFSNPQVAQEAKFLSWYQGVYLQTLLENAVTLNAQHYERHEVDITRGEHAPIPFRYLGMYELSLDGASAAEPLIECIATLHRQQAAAQDAATWLYYPVCERVGRAPVSMPCLLTLAFANSVPGQEAEFREWYATRHIRHALNISALVSGQCYERTQFQRPGALKPAFSTIAVYEQEGSPESILESFASMPQGLLDFPTLDLRPSRFAESVYRPL